MSDPQGAWPEIDPSRAAELESCLTAWGLPTERLALIDQAFTHSSYAFENNLPDDNERLEFLGDAILGFLVACHLYEDEPQAEEGVLSQRKAALVNRLILGRQARALGMDELIRLGRGQAQSGGRARASIVGSALEAVVGAIYLEYGLDAAREFTLRRIVEPCKAHALQPAFHDYKSRFQEIVQKRLQEIPEYRLVDESGPEHDRVFIIEALARGEVFGQGRGSRKKIAENEAARQAIVNLQRRMEEAGEA